MAHNKLLGTKEPQARAFTEAHGINHSATVDSGTCRTSANSIVREYVKACSSRIFLYTVGRTSKSEVRLMESHKSRTLECYDWVLLSFVFFSETRISCSSD